MNEYLTKPVLIPLDYRGTTWMSLCLPAALSVEGWNSDSIDETTILPEATTKNVFHANFFWMDADGNLVTDKQATHLAVQIASSDASEHDCLREQIALVESIKIARDGTMKDLGLW